MTRSDQPADILTRLRNATPYGLEDSRVLADASVEIKRLRAALKIAAGKLSTLEPFTDWHPETIYKALLEDGAEEARRG